jgi:short-subunit dehydrogenase
MRARLRRPCPDHHGRGGACPSAPPGQRGSADLARPDAPREIIADCLANRGRVDVLVNNAGYGLAGSYRETAWEAERDFIQVMVTAPCELAHRLLPSMSGAAYGRIINVASVAGLVPGAASHSLYGAAKAFMISFSEALYAETRGSGIHVTALCPGFTYSEFHDVNGTRAMMNRLPKFLWLTSARVAEEGYAAVMRGDPLCVPTAVYKLIAGVTRMTPRRLALATSLRAQRFRR